mgnify:CR=1 FL=1
MSLKFVFGPSGSGKSYQLYDYVIRESVKFPDRQYIVLVPEQFYDADAEGSCHATSESWNYEYRRT